MRSLAVLASISLLLSACATAGPAGDDTGEADAPTGGRADSAPGTPDAAPKPDSTPGAPDAFVPPPPPDAAPPPIDAAPPPPPIDAAPGAPDAAPMPDAMPPPCTPTWQNVLANPGFDLGPGGGWVEAGMYPLVNDAAGLPAGLPPHTPAYAAWLGGYFDSDDTLYQQITIPAGATELHFKGYRWIATEEIGGTYDFLYFELRNTGGAVLETLATYSNADSVGGWTAFDLGAVSPHAGETLRINVHATTDFSLNTNFFLDTLSVEALVCL